MPWECSSRSAYHFLQIVFLGEVYSASLTPSQLETRFREQNYLDLVWGGGFGAFKGSRQEPASEKKGQPLPYHGFSVKNLMSGLMRKCFSLLLTVSVWQTKCMSHSYDLLHDLLLDRDIL